MKSENMLLIVSIFAVVISVIGAFVVYNSLDLSSRAWFTGFNIQSNATVNLTVESIASINFTTNNINFGSGRVNLGLPNATLDTSLGTVVNGNWTANSVGFVLENIGNNNVTLDIRTTKNATTFLGGTNPRYQYNITNIEAGSCINSTAFALGLFYDVNISSPGTRVCNNFGFADNADQIRIHLRIVIPSDSFIGALSDTMVATATAI